MMRACNGRVAALSALTSVSLVLAPGCDSQPKEEPSVGPEARAPEAGRRVAPRVGGRPISEAIGGLPRSGPPAKLITTQRLRGASRGPVGAEPGDGSVEDSAPGETRRVRYAVKDAEAADVIRVLCGELLDRRFVIGAGVQGTLTFELDGEMTTRELERFLGALASTAGWTIEDRGGTLHFAGAERLAQSPVGPVMEGDAASPDDRPAVRVFTFDYLAPNDALSVAQELANRATARVTAVGKHLVIADRTEQLARFAELFRALDTPVFEGVELWTYELAHVRAREMAEALRVIATSARLPQDAAAFVPLGNTDRLMVICTDATLQTQVRRWVTQLDQATGDQTTQRYIYRIQHYDPAELSTVLQQLFSGRAVIGGATTNPGQMRLVFASEAKQILIDATPEQFTELASVLSVIDAPPQQVQLQAVIAEVTLSNALEYGVEYFLSLQTGEGPVELLGDALSLPSITGSAFFVGSDGFALIEALDRESDVTVLSTPTLTVRDGAEATIQVGGETPVLQSAIDSGGQTGGTTDIRNEIIYRDTGIELTVQPDINESGYVTLNILQEVNDAVQNSTSGIDSPEFTTRLIDTEIVAPHGSTVLLGGIIDTQETVRIDRIPVLGRLPLVGPLFSMNRDMTERTELIITITPTVIDDPESASPLVSEFARSTRSVEAAFMLWRDELPRALGPQEMREHGLGDPKKPAEQDGEPEPAGPRPEAEDGERGSGEGG